MKLISWNVNGLRAVDRKGALKDIFEFKPDILCLQETKIAEDEIPFDLRYISGYESFFSSGERKGYSGVGMYFNTKPLSIETSFGDKSFDKEGRIIQAEFDQFILFNIYFPNGKSSNERLKYKLDFYYSFLNSLEVLLKSGKEIIICGDVNTAHKEVDLARPKQNEKISGFLPEERVWIDKLLDLGFIDTFREFDKDGENYTWWDYKSGARKRNVGWRIDYFFVSKNLKSKLKSSSILNDVLGSDHAPILLDLN